MKVLFLNRKLTIYVGCIYVKGFLGVPGPVNCVTDVEFGLFEERDNRLDFVCPRTRAGINDTARRDSFLIKFTSDPNHHFSSLVAVMTAAEYESVSLNCSEIQAWRFSHKEHLLLDIQAFVGFI